MLDSGKNDVLLHMNPVLECTKRNRLSSKQMPLKPRERVADVVDAADRPDGVIHRAVLQGDQRAQLLLIKLVDALGHVLPQNEIDEGL